jgi:ribosomal 50S subunit-recycling heat shock protein
MTTADDPLADREGEAMKEKPSETVRLDKWLWAARFYKTRALAREMIEGGKVHYNGQRSKPASWSS